MAPGVRAASLCLTAVAGQPGIGQRPVDCSPWGFRVLNVVVGSLLVVCLLASGCSAQEAGREVSTVRSPTEDVSAGARTAVAFLARFCLDAPPSFEAIDRQATGAGYRVFQDRVIGPVHQKEWLVPGATTASPLLLSAGTGLARDQASTLTMCSVAAIGGSGPDLLRVLSADPRLGRPARPASVAPNGGKTVFWTVRFDGTSPAVTGQLMLAYDIPGLPGSPMNLTVSRSR